MKNIFSEGKRTSENEEQDETEDLQKQTERWLNEGGQPLHDDTPSES